MAERYTRLFSLTENLYQTGSPVLIAAGALLKDNQSNKTLAQIKLQSLSNRPIKAAKISITPLDVIDNELGNPIEHQYLDLNIQRNEEFGAKSPIYLPDATTRAFRAAVTSVVFADNTVWSASNAAWEPLPAPVMLDEVYPDAELRKQFMLEFGAQSQYTYAEFADLCRCPCGALNRQDEEKCHSCGCDLSALRSLDIRELEKRKDERLEQERIAEEERQERKKKEAAEAAECAKKAKKIALIAAPIVCVVIAFLIALISVIIPNGKYNNAVALMEAGQYEKAMDIFEDLGEYKDTPERVLECVYGYAVSSMESGAYDVAIVVFETAYESIGWWYKDSEEKLAECMEAQYDHAVALMESDEYADASSAFEVLGDYKDSEEKWFECAKAQIIENAFSDIRDE